MMKINVYQQSGEMVKDRKIRSLVNHVAAAEHYHVPILNIIFADNTYLQKLNEEFFGKKQSTNVISFNLGECSEIYVSNEEVHDVFDLYYFIVHGLLHIIGYDHVTRKERDIMERKCRHYTKNYCETSNV